jgi:hypothetical protein
MSLHHGQAPVPNELEAAAVTHHYRRSEGTTLSVLSIRPRGAVDEVAQRCLQLKRLSDEIEGDLIHRTLDARDDWADHGGAYLAVRSMLRGEPHPMVDDELRAAAGEWSLQVGVHLRHAMEASITEIARRLRTTSTTADRMLRDYLERFDDDEPIPSGGFKAWVDAMDDRGSDDKAAAK